MNLLTKVLDRLCVISADSVHYESIQRHLFVHSKTNQAVECDVCPDKKTFASIERIKWHITFFYQKKYKYPCDKCDRVFTYYSDRKRHKRSHGGVEKKVACLVCDRRFYEAKDLRLHMKSH